MGHRPGTGADLNGRRFDAACVGAGPAGSTCALLLARAGYSVLLLERAALPRPKTCGGGLSARALALLPCDPAPVVHRHMRGARLAVAGRVLADVDAPGIGAMVERAEFDAWLAGQAASAGAELWPATALTGLKPSADGAVLETSRGQVHVRVVVGADGAHSRVRGLLFPAWRPAWAIGLEAQYHWPQVGAAAGAVEAAAAGCAASGSAAQRSGTAAPPVAGELACFDFGALRDGYGWIFPKRDHFNVGVYRLHKPASGATLRARLAAFAAAHRSLDDCHPAQAQGHPIPLSTGRQPVAQGCAVLVGDAAGLGEAFLGEGIAFALDSAHRAAAWAATTLAARSGAADGRAYARSLQPLMAELKYSLRMARLLYRLPPAWLQQVAADPGVQALVVDLLRARRSYRSAFGQLAWRVPVVLLRARPGRLTPERIGG